MRAHTTASGAAAARSGAALIAVGVLLIGVLHLIPPTSAISPVYRTISEYGLTDLAWAFNLGVLAIAAGSLVLGVALARLGRLSPPAAAFGALWVAGLTVLVVFPKHNWAIGPSASGQVHRMASLVAFLALPLALMLLARRAGLSPDRRVFWFGPAALLWFVPIVVAVALQPVLSSGWWTIIPLGLVERGLALTEVIGLVVLGWRVPAQLPVASRAAGSANMVLP